MNQLLFSAPAFLIGTIIVIMCLKEKLKNKRIERKYVEIVEKDLIRNLGKVDTKEKNALFVNATSRNAGENPCGKKFVCEYSILYQLRNGKMEVRNDFLIVDRRVKK